MKRMAIICMSMLLAITLICACLNTFSLAQTSESTHESAQDALEKIRTKLRLASKVK